MHLDRISVPLVNLPPPPHVWASIEYWYIVALMFLLYEPIPRSECNINSPPTYCTMAYLPFTGG